MKKSIYILLLILLIINISQAQSNVPLDPIFKLMAERAELMKEVAAYKWENNHNTSAYNAEQERKVLQNGEILAKENNLNTQSLLIFIQIQMDLSKQIEDYWFEYWNSPTTPKDDLPSKDNIISLDKLREQIKTIDTKLYPEISKNLNLINETSTEDLTKLAQKSFMNKDGVPIKGIPYNDPNFIALLVKALNDIQPNTRLLKVCTAGDYPPLTFYDSKTHQYSGFDIELIKAFAQENNYKIDFIKTTWGSLSEDLETKCDIAVGGITKTPQRSKLFYLTSMILSSKKEPIFSKQNNQRFKNFADINKEGVIVIENKGGTNEAFAKSHINKAKLQILPSNEAVYICLNKYLSKPYVMLTDSVEADWRAGINSNLSGNGLSISIPNNPITEKVYLINKSDNGKILKDQINQFLFSKKDMLTKLYQNAIHQKYDLPSENCPI